MVWFGCMWNISWEGSLRVQDMVRFRCLDRAVRCTPHDCSARLTCRRAAGYPGSFIASSLHEKDIGVVRQCRSVSGLWSRPPGRPATNLHGQTDGWHVQATRMPYTLFSRY